jgi:AsmA protein
MKKFLIITGCIFIIFFSAVLILPRIYSDDIRVKAKQEIDNKIDGLVNFDRISLSLFNNFPNLTLSFHNFSIVGKEEFKSDTLADIKEVSLEMNIWKMLTGNDIEITSVNLDKPRINIEVLKNGKANFNIFVNDTKGQTTADSSSSSLNLNLDKISISDGMLIYNDRSMNAYGKIKGINHIGNGDFIKDIFDYNTGTTLEEVSFEYGNVRYFHRKHIQIELMMEIDVKNKKFTFKENFIKINHFKFGMEGYFSILRNGYDLDMKFETIETSFHHILSLIPGVYMNDFEKIKTKGDIQCSGFMKGIYSDSSDKIPAFHLDIKVKDAMFKVDSLPMAVENIQMDLVLDNKTGLLDSTIIDLRTFHADMGKHPVHGRIKMMGLNNYDIDADIFADIDLAELESMFPIKGIDLKGKLDFELKAKGKYKNLPSSISKSSKNKPEEVPAFHLKMQLADGKLKYNHLPEAIDHIQFHLLADNTTNNIENTIIDLKSMQMDLGKNPINISARVEGYENYRLKSDIKANLDLADIERMYPIDGLILKGVFNLDVEADGEYSETKKKFPVIDAKMNLINGYLKSKDYPEPLENIHLISEATNKSGDFSSTNLKINKLTYTLEDEPFVVSGTVSDLKNYVYDLKIKGLVDLEKLTRIYPIKDMKVTGIISTDIESRGKISDIEAGNYNNIASSGNIEVQNLNLTGKAVPKNILIKDALFTFTPAKILLEKFQGKFGRSNITMTGDLSNYMCFITKSNDLIKGDMNLTCDTLDMNEWLANPNTSNSPPLSPDPSKKTGSSAQITVWEVPKNIDFIFDSDIKVTIYEDMNITHMQGDIKIKEGVLTLHETGFNTLNAKFNISGDYDTRDMKHPLFDFVVAIDELDINKAYRESKLIRDLAPAASNTFGILSLDYKIKGELANDMSPKTETMNGGGTIRIAEAKIDGMKIFEEISKAARKKEMNDPHLKDFVMVTEIKDNKLIVKPFSLKISGFDTEIEGTNNINGAIQYIIKIELLPVEKLSVPFHVSGTYDNPKVSLGKGHTLPEM